MNAFSISDGAPFGEHLTVQFVRSGVEIDGVLRRCGERITLPRDHALALIRNKAADVVYASEPEVKE